MDAKLKTELINGIPFTFQYIKVSHGRFGPPTMEWSCVDCHSYMTHTGISVQNYHCSSCGHTADRVSHVVLNSEGEPITHLTRAAGLDIRRHTANRNCKFVLSFFLSPSL